MKKLVLSFAMLCSMGITAWAQAPAKFNYQGVARSTDGTPMASTVISMRLTVLEGSATGSVDYQETQPTVSTNIFGLYTVFVGGGSPNTAGGGAATLGAVNWGSGDKYLLVEIDPLGGTAYTSIGTAQLMSVPYALYAANSPATGVTSVTAGTGLSGGTITSTGTISMPNVGTAGSYGSGTTVPKITTDAQGRVTGVVNTPITAGAGTVTSINSGTGLTGGPITSSGTLSLATAGTASTYGSSTTVPVFTTDMYGRVISVVNTPIVTAGTGTVTSVTAGTGLSGGTITTSGTVSMPNVGTPGTYGSATAIPQITTDAQGRVTAVTIATVTATGGVSGTTNYISKFTSPTAVGNSAMYNTPGNQVGLGTLTPIATFDAESASDTMAGNFIISNPTPPGNGVLSASYTGDGTSVSPIAIIGTSQPLAGTVATGLGVGGIGGELGVSGVAQADDFFGQCIGAQGQSFGDGDASIGVLGAASELAPFLTPNDNYGVYGTTDGNGFTEDFAGEFVGNLNCTGVITGSSKLFKIDHPLDPANKFLYHTCIESNEMMDMYTGNITTDASGVATVVFPTYMEALNTDFRYQLTVIGTFAQAIVSKEMTGNQFEIKTSTPNTKVSWQVTGVRHDAFAVAHPLIVEVAKKGNQIGKYESPESFGKSKDLQIGRINPKLLKGVKKYTKNTQAAPVPTKN